MPSPKTDGSLTSAPREKLKSRKRMIDNDFFIYFLYTAINMFAISITPYLKKIAGKLQKSDCNFKECRISLSKKSKNTTFVTYSSSLFDSNKKIYASYPLHHKIRYSICDVF